MTRRNKVTIEISHVVRIRQGLVNRLLSLSDYAELVEAIFMNPPENVIWQAQMTNDMVSTMTGDQIDEMIQTLDESVELALDGYELSSNDY
jgi:hypothetical protein